MAKMARQYLGCPASSASVERIFSVAGQFFDDLRRQLDDKKLEELMWAAINKGNRRKEYGSSTERRLIYLVNGDISI